MALFSAGGLIKTFESAARTHNFSANAEIVLANDARDASGNHVYDIFLSHSFLDARIIYGLKLELERRNYSVYVYWAEEGLPKQPVNAGTADRLRRRMRSCKCLLYAASENSPGSKWMPWELGYFDGIKGTVAILPIAQGTDYYFTGFKNQEYLDLYPYISCADGVDPSTLNVWSRDKSRIVDLNQWVGK